MTAPDFDKLFGPELVYEPAGPIVPCAACGAIATYTLQMISMQLRTSEGALHMVQSTPTPDNRIAVCAEHKDDDLEEYIAGGCHLAIMQQTNVTSELEAYNLYWTEL